MTRYEMVEVGTYTLSISHTFMVGSTHGVVRIKAGDQYLDRYFVNLVLRLQ